MNTTNLPLRQQEALTLAKSAILEEFGKESLEGYRPLSKELQVPWAAFVTLRKGKDERWELRWCIGSLIPTRFLWQDIIINAKNAAFRDPRFPPLTEQELSWPLFLEISVLSHPYPVEFQTIHDLLQALREKKPWVIIQLGSRQATFLPSVWKELPDEEQFLIHLLLKAGISPEEFVANFHQAKIFFYDSEEFGSPWDQILTISEFLQNVWR